MDKNLYKLLFGGVVIGVVTSLAVVFIFFKPQFRQESKPQQARSTPFFGEPGYNPEIVGYPALIGNVKSISAKELILTLDVSNRKSLLGKVMFTFLILILE